MPEKKTPRRLTAAQVAEKCKRDEAILALALRDVSERRIALQTKVSRNTVRRVRERYINTRVAELESTGARIRALHAGRYAVLHERAHQFMVANPSDARGLQATRWQKRISATRLTTANGFQSVHVTLDDELVGSITEQANGSFVARFTWALQGKAGKRKRHYKCLRCGYSLNAAPVPPCQPYWPDGFEGLEPRFARLLDSYFQRGQWDLAADIATLVREDRIALQAELRDCSEKIAAIDEEIDDLFAQASLPAFRARASRKAEQRQADQQELVLRRQGLEASLSTLGERAKRKEVVARALFASGGLGALFQRLPYEGQKAIARAAAPSGIRVTRKGELLTPHAPAIAQVFGPSDGVPGSAEPGKEVWWT